MKTLRVQYWKTRERRTSDAFTSLVEAIRFMREKEQEGYTTLLV